MCIVYIVYDAACSLNIIARVFAYISKLGNGASRV